MDQRDPFHEERPEPSNFFTLRMWMENLERSGQEWRGQIHSITTGEVRYFRDWDTLVSHIKSMIVKNKKESP